LSIQGRTLVSFFFFFFFRVCNYSC
jgi:hypothetical protein